MSQDPHCDVGVETLVQLCWLVGGLATVLLSNASVVQHFVLGQLSSPHHCYPELAGQLTYSQKVCRMGRREIILQAIFIVDTDLYCVISPVFILLFLLVQLLLAKVIP